MTPKKVLLIASDQGFHWNELADAFHAFRDAGWQMDLASPNGHPKADTKTLRTGLFWHLLGKGTLKNKLPKTPWWGRPVVETMMRARKLGDVDLTAYDAFFFTNGYGASFDLDRNPIVLRILQDPSLAGRWVVGPVRKQIGDPELRIYYRGPRGVKRAIRKLTHRVAGFENPSQEYYVAEFMDRKSGTLRKFHK